MILLVAAWYNEPNYNFKISHKVMNFIRELIKEQVFEVYGLNDIDKDWYLKLSVSTSSETKNLEVKGPAVRKRAKFIDYGLWLPHDIINNSENPLKEYIHYYFEALKIVFSTYSVPENTFDDLKKITEKEVLNNELYY